MVCKEYLALRLTIYLPIISYRCTHMGGDVMAVVKASSSDIDLLARLLRAEAEGEGEQGIRTIPQMVYHPHAFEATTKGYFYQRAERPKDA